MNVVRPPGVVMIAPGIGAWLDRGEPIPALVIGVDPAFAAKIRIDGRVVLISRVLVTAGGVSLPDFDNRIRYRPAALIGDAAVHDDALAKRRLAVDDRQIGDRWKMRGAEA